MDLILIFIVTFSAGFTIFYSFKTRTYRKQQELNLMKFYNSKTNVAMGIMLIALAIIQFTFEELTGWRIGVGLTFLVLGLINFIVGIRHYQQYSS